MLECGLSPALPTEIVAVARTYPIRVAGNSGPMPNEISWPVLARNLNFKRESLGLEPLVKHESIEIFEMAVKAAARSGEFYVPEFSDGNDQHVWADRRLYAPALSELNSTAWGMIPHEVQNDLMNLFELTTVTKKLRRIAGIDLNTMSVSGRQMRPAWVAVTFMNYINPGAWYELPPDQSDFEHPIVEGIEATLRAPVGMLTYGPGDEHILVRRA